MILKYSILWFEDSRALVDSLSPSIAEHLENLGFDFDLEVRPDDEKLEEMVREFDPDLILVDYDLAREKKGDVLVDKIREIGFYVDAILYSDKYSDYLERLKVEQLEGVYFTVRKELLKKTLKLIDRTVKKQQDVRTMRGLIIALTIDLEIKMDILIIACLGVDDERKGVVNKILDPEFDVLSLKKKYDLINKICKERIKALARQHEKAGPEEKEKIQAIRKEMEGRKGAFTQAYQEVILVRNIMAHAKEEPKSKNTLISDIGKEEVIKVDNEFCSKTRKNFRKHAENLDRLIALIQT